jgi:transportin-1
MVLQQQQQIIPTPSGGSLALVSALIHVENHALHVAAIQARDAAFADPIAYSSLLLQLSYILVGCDQSKQMMQSMDPNELILWQQTDQGSSLKRLQQDPSLWIPFGQTAGLLLKNALIRPPMLPSTGQVLTVSLDDARRLQESLLVALQCRHSELRSVASSVVAAVTVSPDALQPHLHLTKWPHLIDTLLQNIEQHIQFMAASSTSSAPLEEYCLGATVWCAAEGSVQVLRKMMEDGLTEIPTVDLDRIVVVLIRCLAPTNGTTESVPAAVQQLQNSIWSPFRIAALQSLVSCLSDEVFPSAMVAHWTDYLYGLSYLAGLPEDNGTRQWVCRNIVTILQHRTEYLTPHLAQICPFILAATASSPPQVALEACDFWLTFASLDDAAASGDPHDVVGALLPQLIPVLLDNMVYPFDKQRELEWLNRPMAPSQAAETRPIFHKSKAATKHAVGNVTNPNNEDDDGDSIEEDDDDDEEEEYDDDDGWTLRKCSAASLDALSNLYGGEMILPHLLPALEVGLQQTADPWRQEACLLALGAVAEGCYDDITEHLHQIFPYLMHILSAASDGPQPMLPQLKCTAAWTAGQYAAWVVEQVQMNVHGHVLAELSELLLRNLSDTHPKIQVSCGAAFGVLVGAAGDLLTPYLLPIFTALTAALTIYKGRSLRTIIDVFGTIGECVGPAIAEGSLPSLYVPPLIQLWEHLMVPNGVTTTTVLLDRTVLPLMESIASVALACGMNFQPYSLECFDNAMSMIESTTLQLASSSEDAVIREEDVDPIIAAADLIDSLVEGLGANFSTLLKSSPRFGPQFLNVLLSLCQNEFAGVRMSALALVGDLTRNTPSTLQPALPHLIHETINCMDPIQPSVAINAVWAVGEICVQCQGQPAILEPHAGSFLQNAIGLLMGNGILDSDGRRGSTVPGLVENVAAAVGRLALVNPNFVAADLPRFLCGWCDGLGKIRDATERRDAFTGFLQVMYTNPQAILQASSSVSDAIASILFAILSWHVPDNLPDESYSKMLTGQFSFVPFPSTEADLGLALVKLVHDIKSSVSESEWNVVTKRLPVNARKLFRDVYNL